MWQCRLEIEYYIPLHISISSLCSKHRISELQGWSSNVLYKYGNYRCNYALHLSPALNGSSEIQRFERSDAIEIRDRIIFDFYTGLPHMCKCANSFRKSAYMYRCMVTHLTFRKWHITQFPDQIIIHTRF